MSADAPPIYSHPGELNTKHTVPFPKCKSCGKPKRPAPETLLKLGAAEIDDPARELYGLCERCRRLHYQTAMKSLADGAPAERKL